MNPDYEDVPPPVLNGSINISLKKLKALERSAKIINNILPRIEFLEEMFQAEHTKQTIYIDYPTFDLKLEAFKSEIEMRVEHQINEIH
jgi:hypothetical protein